MNDLKEHAEDFATIKRLEEEIASRASEVVKLKRKHGIGTCQGCVHEHHHGHPNCLGCSRIATDKYKDCHVKPL